MGAISTSACDYYKISSSADCDTVVAVVGLWGPVVFIVFAPIVGKLTDWYGLRAMLLLGAGLEVACGISRWWATPDQLWLVHLGAIFNAANGPIVLGLPAQLSMTWFPRTQRSTATAVGILANSCGSAVGFLALPALTDAFGVLGMMRILGAASVATFVVALVRLPPAPPAAPSPSALAIWTKLVPPMVRMRMRSGSATAHRIGAGGLDVDSLLLDARASEVAASHGVEGSLTGGAGPKRTGGDSVSWCVWEWVMQALLVGVPGLGCGVEVRSHEQLLFLDSSRETGEAAGPFIDVAAVGHGTAAVEREYAELLGAGGEAETDTEAGSEAEAEATLLQELALLAGNRTFVMVTVAAGTTIGFFSGWSSVLGAQLAGPPWHFTEEADPSSWAAVLSSAVWLGFLTQIASITAGFVVSLVDDVAAACRGNAGKSAESAEATEGWCAGAGRSGLQLLLAVITTMGAAAAFAVYAAAATVSIDGTAEGWTASGSVFGYCITSAFLLNASAPLMQELTADAVYPEVSAGTAGAVMQLAVNVACLVFQGAGAVGLLSAAPLALNWMLAAACLLSGAMLLFARAESRREAVDGHHQLS